MYTVSVQVYTVDYRLQIGSVALSAAPFLQRKLLRHHHVAHQRAFSVFFFKISHFPVTYSSVACFTTIGHSDAENVVIATVKIILNHSQSFINRFHHNGWSNHQNHSPLRTFNVRRYSSCTGRSHLTSCGTFYCTFTPGNNSDTLSYCTTIACHTTVL
jgi:hypothetical protein